jgi:hypothetical protein
VDPGKPGAQTAASSLSSRDLWMTGQRPLLYRHWPGGICAPGLLAWCRRGSRRARTGGGRSCRTRGPAPGACPRVPAVPAQVGAGTAAIGHHLLRGQADAAQPAGLGAGLSCPVLDRPRLDSYGPLACKSLGTRGGGAESGDGHRRGGGLEPRVPSPRSPLRQPFADLGCAGHLACPLRVPAVARAFPLQRNGLTRPRSSKSHGPDATLRPDRFPVNVHHVCPPLRHIMWTTPLFLLCTGCEWRSRS